MRLLHERWRRRVSLLAASSLEGAERDETLAHIEKCVGCREDHERLQRMLDELERDPGAEPPVPVDFLIRRVLARVDEPMPASLPMRALRWAPVAVTTVAVAVAVWMATPRVEAPGGAAPEVAVALSTPDPTSRLEIPEETLRRMERAVVREQAARYLAEAQDVLVTVASSRERCRREGTSVDVSQETRRSRELLARRALVVDVEGDAVVAARPVIEDVEEMLREVAALEACARQGDLDQIHDSIKRRKLLMKIDLMEKELLG
jgi:hypothetical protein